MKKLKVLDKLALTGTDAAHIMSSRKLKMLRCELNNIDFGRSKGGAVGAKT